MKKRVLWHLGNTTVRSPFRLKDGLGALANSPLQGNLRGENQEKAFRKLLGDNGIVELGSDETYSVGRKWRAALSQLGFLVPEIPKKLSIKQEEIGPVDTITENGLRLIASDSVPAMQECFLRALAAYTIPNPLEDDYDFKNFSPLQHILLILKELENQTGSSHLNFIEMATVVQISNSEDDLKQVVKDILDLRAKREAAENKRQFDNILREGLAKKLGYVATTFNDYADTNFRYLKASGLVQSKGRGIILFKDKQALIEKLTEEQLVPKDNVSYFKRLCRGAELPTDRKEEALEVLRDLVTKLEKRGQKINLQEQTLTDTATITVERHNAEKKLLELEEEDYALEQVAQWREILDYMNVLQGGKKVSEDSLIKIPHSEAPAYFEWILWRAFLAIDHLKNKSHEARRFKIDQDLLPVGTAPGNGPDLIFEFEDFVLVVEVTLTENSRQEAAEGDPVRRHIAIIQTQYPDKKVYGLFIAKTIDPNTAETFLRGTWYAQEKKVDVNVIPLTLNQFSKIFSALFEAKKNEPQYFKKILEACSETRTAEDGPSWQKAINATVQTELEAIAS